MKQILYILGFIILIFITRKVMSKVKDAPEEEYDVNQNSEEDQEEEDEVEEKEEAIVTEEDFPNKEKE